MALESKYDYSTTVAVLSCTAVFKQNSHPRYNKGAVALKVTSALVPLANKDKKFSESNKDVNNTFLSAPELLSSNVMYANLREAEIYSLLCPHPSIPEFVESVEDFFDTSRFFAKEHHRGVQRLPVLVTQFVKAVSLDRLFRSFPVINWSVVMGVVWQVATVLQHIHKKGVVYGDLKLPNVLVGASGHVWLVDYASAVEVEIQGKEIKIEEVSNGITRHIRAPELFSTPNTTLKYPFMVDFWAFGAFLLELLTGCPYLGSFEELSGSYTQEELELKVLKGYSVAKQRYTNTCNHAGCVWEALKELLLGLLRRDPESRLGFNDEWDGVFKHTFFAYVRPELSFSFPLEYDDEIDELMAGL